MQTVTGALEFSNQLARAGANCGTASAPQVFDERRSPPASSRKREFIFDPLLMRVANVCAALLK
jgi:hypothetical protein